MNIISFDGLNSRPKTQPNQAQNLKSQKKPKPQASNAAFNGQLTTANHELGFCLAFGSIYCLCCGLFVSRA